MELRLEARVRREALGEQQLLQRVLEQNVQDGQGRYIWKNGNEYKGEWKNGVISGHGVFNPPQPLSTELISKSQALNSTLSSFSTQDFRQSTSLDNGGIASRLENENHHQSTSLRRRAIYASDLLFLRKKSLAAPIHQNCFLLLSTLKKPADQLLHVSTSVENLKFKCETAAMSTVMKKNITGVHLATRWAVTNVVYQQLNALALTPYPTLSIMTSNLSPGKAGYSSWDSWHQSTEVENKSRTDISFLIQREGEKPFVCKNLKAGDKEVFEKELFQNYHGMKVPTTVIIRAGSAEGTILPQDIVNYKKLFFNIDANGKLVGSKMTYKDELVDLLIV